MDANERENEYCHGRMIPSEKPPTPEEKMEELITENVRLKLEIQKLRLMLDENK